MYLPWLGYFDRIARSDIHIVLDHVQFEKNSMINRNKIRTKETWNWLTIPIKTKNKFGKLDIKNLSIDNTLTWKQKHWKSIKFNYSNAKYFKNYANFFENLFKNDWLQLLPIIKFVNNYIFEELDIKTKIIYSSNLNPKLTKSEMILELCRKVGANKYISGPFGRDYLNIKEFDNNGIKIDFHDYLHPVYAQAYSGFEYNMSIIDLLFNHGRDTIKILKNE